jgi:hypothetical protein
MIMLALAVSVSACRCGLGRTDVGFALGCGELALACELIFPG